MTPKASLKFTEMGVELEQVKDGVTSSKMLDLNELKMIFANSININTGLMASSEGVCRFCVQNNRALVYYLIPSQFRDVTYHNEISHTVIKRGLQDDSIETFKVWTPPVILRLVMVPAGGTPEEPLYTVQNSCAYCWEGGRITHDSRIYVFPFGNVYCSGDTGDYICWGRTNKEALKIPRNLCEGLYDLAGLFWVAHFNGHLQPNIFPREIAGVQINEVRDFLCFLVDRDHYPVELLPYYSTFNDWMKKKDREDNFA